MNKIVLFLVSFILLGCGLSTKTKVPVSIKNKLGIPQSCIDSTDDFKPIKTITTRLGYNEKAHPYQPIQSPKGFIEHDFNGDGKRDYVFIERSSKSDKSRLATCIDGTRRTTHFIIHEEKQADFQTIYEIVRLYQGKLQLSINRHEHNWGSDSETSLYRYDKNHNDFMLLERLIYSSSGDGLRSDTEEHYKLGNKRFRLSSRCGSLEQGCRPRKQKGRIILSSTPITLFKQGGKLYKRLIPD